MKPDGRHARIGLMVLGTALLVLGQVRWGVGLLAWFAPVPFLLFLRSTDGWRSRLVLLGVLSVAWSIAAGKYITPPFPRSLILVNGLSFAVVSFIGYAVWDRLRRFLSSTIGNLGFAAIFTSIEWLQYMFTPMASNGAAAYTQLENLPFLQSASLFGITGISFIMYWFAAVAADTIIERRVPRQQAAVVIGLIVAAHVFGAFRIGSPSKSKTVRVATVGTDFDWFGGPIPGPEERTKIEDALFEHTDEAARAKARLIVWNEVSTIVLQAEETAFLARAQRVAKQHGVHLVLAYLLPITVEPFLVENKYVWIGPRGIVLDTYLKHKPVPGEPSQPGDGVAKVIETGFGRATGAICYEFDFPQIGLDRARKNADIVFVPSSDNLGVDPFHTQIAAIRAIEGGYSVLRSTRMGLSAGIDQLGRIRGWLSANETKERIMLAELPIGKRWTLYSVVGDAVAYLAMAFIVIVAGWKIKRTR